MIGDLANFTDSGRVKEKGHLRFVFSDGVQSFGKVVDISDIFFVSLIFLGNMEKVFEDQLVQDGNVQGF